MSRGGGIPAEALLDLRRRLDEDTRAYLDWLLGECAEDGVEVDSLIKPAALDLMAIRLSTPLQFAEQFHARPTEIRRFLNGQLDPGRTRELPEGTCPRLSSMSFVQGSTR